MEIDHNYFMGLAITQAQNAATQGEVPIGAILISNGEIYSAQGNTRESTNDPTAHAEVLAIRHAAEILGNWRLENSTMYVTAEPCVQCTGALYLARVSKVVFGCTNPKGGALRFIKEHEKSLNLNHSMEVISGVRELECAKLLKDFFHLRRRDGRVVEGA